MAVLVVVVPALLVQYRTSANKPVETVCWLIIPQINMCFWAMSKQRFMSVSLGKTAEELNNHPAITKRTGRQCGWHYSPLSSSAV